MACLIIAPPSGAGRSWKGAPCAYLSLTLANYRNYARAELRPCAGVTVLAGDNAQGKTNLLEAVYLCCQRGARIRTRQDRELIRWGEEFCRVAVEAERRDGTHADGDRHSPRPAGAGYGSTARRSVVREN